MVTEHTPICFRCGDMEHLSFECTERRINKEKQAAIKRFTAIQDKFSNRHGEDSSYAEALKRNRSQSRSRPSQGALRNPKEGDKKDRAGGLEDRVLNLEIRMTEMQNLLMEIANKVQYWEDMEEAEYVGGEEEIDTENHMDTEERVQSKATIQEAQPNQKEAVHKGYRFEQEEDIRGRQE